MKRGESIGDWIARCDAREARLQSSPHVVYRAFDEFGLLLYIGCTVNLERRMTSHRSFGGSRWAPFAAEIKVVEYASKEAARAAEKSAIDSERSYFNSTQADIQRTQANRHAAVRSLREIGIYEPRWTGEVDEIFEGSPSWQDHCDEHVAYMELRRELEQVLKAGAFPYLTPEDRLDNYLAARSLAERRAA